MRIFVIAYNIFKANINSYKLSIINLSMIVSLFYCFSALVNNEFIQNLSGIVYIQLAISMCYLIFIFFIVYFVFNTNSYILKSRTKEIGLYQILGIRKTEILSVIYIESVIVAIISNIIGISIGIILSKLFLYGFSIVSIINYEINYGISLKAIYATIALYYVAVVFSNSFTTYRIAKMGILETLNFSKISEQNGKARVFKGVISVILILGAYVWMYFMEFENLLFVAIAILIMVMIGTSLFFSSFMPPIFERCIKNKNLLYKGKNLFVLSNLRYRINTNNKTWTMIAISTATIISTLSLSVTLGYHILILRAENLQNVMGVEDNTALFIGALFAYLGPMMALIFTISLCATLLFRFGTEIVEDGQRYKILHKMGLNQSGFKNIVKAQIGLAMYIPAALGIEHGIVASYVIKIMFDFEIFVSVTIAVLIYLFIYYLFYKFIVHISHKKIMQIIEKVN